MYSSTPSLTLVLDGAKWTLAHTGHLNPGKDPVPIVQEAGWAWGLACMEAEKFLSTGVWTLNSNELLYWLHYHDPRSEYYPTLYI